MTKTEDRVVAHYGTGGLYDRIMAALAASGVASGDLTPDHLKGVDEFHVGGVAATAALLDQIDIGPETRVLDIGAGIGGTARLIAARYGSEVTGLDLTPEFVDTAARLTRAVGLRARFVTGSALDMPFADGSFDLATLFHVGMNLADKTALFRETARVLAHGGRFAVYDIMRFGADPVFPVPWASGPDTSFLAAPEDYVAAGEAAGLMLTARRDRGEAATDFFAALKARTEKSGPPPVGLPLIMGEGAGVKYANMVEAVKAGGIAPVEMIFQKR